LTALGVPARRESLELLDRPEAVLADLPQNLRDIRLLNRWLGGAAIATRSVFSLLGPKKHATLLDVATGSADIPVALLNAAGRDGKSLDITALDISPPVLEQARDVIGEKQVRIVRGDARALPWPDSTFEIVLCCLALHHFEPVEATSVLSEMWRVSRYGIAVVDLRRSYAAYACTWLVTRVLVRNRITRHDGPLSVLRAYTPQELSGLARDAGLGRIEITRVFPFRQVLIARKGAHGRRATAPPWGRRSASRARPARFFRLTGSNHDG
jgi:2-polyprenyl-3-methyl-5-hydroxy-6-metoxy-1,4-benzoquinol methylase